MPDAGVDVIHGEATFVDNKTVAVNGETYCADIVVVSTGGYPLVPEIAGAEFGITSNEFFALEESAKTYRDCRCGLYCGRDCPIDVSTR